MVLDIEHLKPSVRPKRCTKITVCQHSNFTIMFCVHSPGNMQKKGKQVSSQSTCFIFLAKGIAAVAKIREINVETDPEKIVNCCCINYRIGEQPIPLKPDKYGFFIINPRSEYPDWLWKLRTDRGSPPLEEVDKNSYYYWRRIRKMNRNLINKLASVDGWHRKDHRSFENHALRFYGNLYLAVSEWSNLKKLLENKN
ncbi:unnamed protein product [Schistosoma guineensis]|nr:unnamed protein product [Schistosoma guineensis]